MLYGDARQQIPVDTHQHGCMIGSMNDKYSTHDRLLLLVLGLGAVEIAIQVISVLPWL